MAEKTYIVYANVTGSMMAHVQAQSVAEAKTRAGTADAPWMPAQLSVGDVFSVLNEDGSEEREDSGVHDLSRWFQE
jgi:hypothetical protein